MKQILLGILLLFSSVAVAQQNYCGTVTTPQVYQDHLLRIASYNDFKNQRAGKLFVPIFYHLIGKTDKTGLMRMSDILQSHCELNAAYDSSNIYFYIVGFDTIYNDTYFSFANYSTGNDILDLYNQNGVCNIYINNSPAGNCGYAFFPNTRTNDGIFVSKGCHGPKSSTLMHEMGHYLGLPHTFESWGGVEFVNGSNCSSAGDFFCDTPADFLDYRWTCPYTGNETDPNGDLYRTVLDGSLYMSYSNDACQKKFSPMQRNHTYNTLQNERTILLANQPQTIPDNDTVRKLLPLSGDTTLNAKGVLFTWNAVPNATHYIFQIPTTVTNVYIFDTITADTSIFVTKLNPNITYRWRVKAYSFLNTCSEFSALYYFKTAAIKAVPLITENTCTAVNNAAIQLDLTGGIAPYIYYWSNGDTTAVINGLSAGRYYFTVTDATGEVVTGSALIANQGVLSSAIVYSAGTLIANVNGGVLPYSYNWSNGSTSPTTTMTASGTYTLTVTDANACESIATFTYNSIDNSEQNIIEVKIIPNPVDNNISILSQQSIGEVGISIYDIMGNIIWKNEHLPIISDRANFDRPLSISSGIYLIKIKIADKTVHKKLVFK